MTTPRSRSFRIGLTLGVSAEAVVAWLAMKLAGVPEGIALGLAIALLAFFGAVIWLAAESVERGWSASEFATWLAGGCLLVAGLITFATPARLVPTLVTGSAIVLLVIAQRTSRHRRQRVATRVHVSEP